MMNVLDKMAYIMGSRWFLITSYGCIAIFLVTVGMVVKSHVQ